MARLVECIPNFSEGRNQEVIDELLKAAEDNGARILNHSSDPSHNRCVITMCASPEDMENVVVAMAKVAAERIDLTKHTGEHPRMGAMDVCPFLPLKDVTVDDCIELSKRVGKRLWEEVGIPVFLYEDSASAPHRKNLAKIRKGQFEGMAEKVLQDEWHPDFGDNVIHPTAGVVAVGARAPLVAYNINLSTDDVAIADKIAKTIREIGGGLKYVKALGVETEINGKKVAQVSINMTNYSKTPLYRVFEFVRFEAERYGLHIIGSEVIGLTPMDALIESAMYYLKLNEFDKDEQVLEKYLI